MQTTFQDQINNRVLSEAKHIINNCSTVRETAQEFQVSKSTVHRDMSVKLKQLDQGLYRDVNFVLNCNLEERHIRGGKATKQRYKAS